MMETGVYKMSPSRATAVPRPLILLVDDEKRIADTLALILNSKGYRAEAAYDGAAALEICRRMAPDLVLTDVVMPGMNGVELAIKIRELFGPRPILLFSGQAETSEILQDAKQRGYDFEILAKPIHPEKLLTRISELLRPHDARPQRARA